MIKRVLAALALTAATRCGADAPAPPSPLAATSTALRPTRPPEYYVAQANLYFDTLDTRADPMLVPNYAALVARWEWPPWYLLTGYEREGIVAQTRLALFAEPSTVPTRDCRAFATQPFARCRVSFTYARGACPIYEEFTFNDAGETTFIEAWSDQPGMRPTEDVNDPWAEAPGIRRLSTRVPGLGNPAGRIDPTAPWTVAVAQRDPEVADLMRRAQSFTTSWLQAFRDAGRDAFARGCGWPTS